MPTRCVIVGSGIAGITAAEVIRRLDAEASIAMVSEEPHDFYSRPGLAYYLRGDFPERQLTIRTPDDCKKMGIQRIHARVENVLTETRELLLADGKKIRYDRALLSTGALAVTAPFPGKELSGVVKLDGLDDTRDIIKRTAKGKPAVVVGGGITALELAEGLQARGMKVQYFLRGERYLADVLDETESKIVMDRLRHEGIQIHLKTQVKEAYGKNGILTGVETQDGKKIPCTVLAVAIGVRPRIDLALKAGLTVNKGVIVNEYMQTSVLNVFAAGDCAEFRDPVTGAGTLDVLWPTAIAHGRIAGAAMAGRPKAYVKPVSCNVTMLGGLKVTIIGSIGGGAKNDDLVAITRGESESWRVRSEGRSLASRDAFDRVRLNLGSRTILGALVMGDQKYARALQQLVTGQVDISSIRVELMQGGPAAFQTLVTLANSIQRSTSGAKG